MRKEERFSVRELPIGATLKIGEQYGKIDKDGILHIATLHSLAWVNTKQTLKEYNTKMVLEPHEYQLNQIIRTSCNMSGWGQIKFGREVFIFKSRKKYRNDIECYRITYMRPVHKGYYGHGAEREKRYLGGESWEIDLQKYPQFLDVLRKEASIVYNDAQIYKYTVR